MSEAPTQHTLEEHLKNHFGFNSFKPYQKEIIQAQLEKKDILAILPTGSGKSLCYQLPAILSPGLSIVISPLIALMQDQVLQLNKQGIQACMLNSSTSWENNKQLEDVLHQQKLLYVSPERLANPFFQDQLKDRRAYYR